MSSKAVKMPRMPKVTKPALPKVPKAKVKKAKPAKGKAPVDVGEGSPDKKDKPMTLPEVTAALRAAAHQQYGAESVWAPTTDLDLKVMSTLVDSLDVALGTGGWVYGRMYMLHGDESCGKTTLALLACVAAQRAGGFAMYADAEHKLDLRWFKRLGGDPEALYVYWPRNIEQYFDMTEANIRAVRATIGPDKPIVAVLDSLQSLQSTRRDEAGWDAAQRSPESLAYSDCLKKFMPVMNQDPILFLIDQVRKEQDGYKVRDKFGMGKACGHYCVAILDMDKDLTKDVIALYGKGGIGTRCMIVKNQMGGIPYTETTWGIMYGHGVDIPGSVLVAGEATGCIVKTGEKGGGWRVFVIGDQPYRFQGEKGIRALAIEKPEVYAALRAQIREATTKPVQDLLKPEAEG